MGMKGHPQSNCGGGSAGGGGGWMMKKRKMAIVAVVLLVAVMGVMVVQKVRNRRLFNLVIKDKDRQILSLHLLLQNKIEVIMSANTMLSTIDVQKERQYAKENKRKNQDLNAKLYSLRTQKIELNNKIMEMRSTIASMRDEQRALELAIDEKQNEIKQKESEIKDLKSSLQTPPKIWSVSSDDPSNRQVNLTNKVINMRRSSWFGRFTNGERPNHQESVIQGNKEIINPDVKVQKPKDDVLGEVSSSREHEIQDLNVDLRDDAKIELHNTTDDKENGNGLSRQGRRYFIGASESQRDKSEKQATGLTTQIDGQSGKSQLTAIREEGPTEVTHFKLRKRSTDQETKKDDPDETEIEADMNHSTESSNGSEADQDYKEIEE